MMPMPTYMGAHFVSPAPTSHTTEMFFDDISRQVSMSQPRRYSRGAGGHCQHTHGHAHSHSQHIGNAMRVSKPSSSANNSPRSASMQARRRTMMNDGLLARRNQQLLEQAFLPSPSAEATLMEDPTKRTSTRPVSWHPSSSQLGQPQQQQIPYHQQQVFGHQQVSPLMQYPFPTYTEVDLYTQYQPQFPPTPAAYSGYSSPTAFSPLSLPYSAFETPQYTLRDDWVPPHEAVTKKVAVSPPSDCPGLLEQNCAVAQSAPSTAVSDASTARWDAFTQDGFRKAPAAPPTPDNYPAVPPPEPVIPSEESIPYQPLEDDEEEGEILIGMGLYDPPEKPIVDPTLDNYRASVAHLLGTSYNYPEPTGKGLKLEDEWEPPAKEDDDEDDEDENDGDEDADGEEQD